MIGQLGPAGAEADRNPWTQPGSYRNPVAFTFNGATGINFVALGFRALSFAEFPSKLGLPSLHSGHWDPLLAACHSIGSSTLPGAGIQLIARGGTPSIPTFTDLPSHSRLPPASREARIPWMAALAAVVVAGVDSFWDAARLSATADASDGRVYHTLFGVTGNVKPGNGWEKDLRQGLAGSQKSARKGKDDINALFEEGITSGCTPTTFCPTALVTRGQMTARELVVHGRAHAVSGGAYQRDRLAQIQWPNSSAVRRASSWSVSSCTLRTTGTTSPFSVPTATPMS